MKSFKTYFISFIALRNDLDCRRISSYSFNTHLLSLKVIQKQILMHEHSYQQIYYTFIMDLLHIFSLLSGTNINIPPFPRITLSHISWFLYQSRTCFIINKNFLLAFPHVISVLTWSGTNLGIFGFFYCFSTSTYFQPRSQSHLFAIRGRRKRGPGTLQTRDQNLLK